jgi:hypothetical protein
MIKGPYHYEDVPARGDKDRFRVADNDDNVVQSFESEEAARAFVRGHNIHWFEEMLSNPEWRF